MIRLVELVLLALVVALTSVCNGHSVNNQSDLNHQLDKRFNQMELKVAELMNMLENLNRKLDNHTFQTVSSAELSEQNSTMEYLGAQIKQLRVKIESLNSKPCNQNVSVICHGRCNITVPRKTFEVLYENNEYGNDWIVIQHRYDGETDFYRNWTEYRNGFGSLNGEFWLGLENIHVLTSSNNYRLLILLEDFNGVKKYARYSWFEIGGESEGYNLKTLGTYSGKAGDSLEYSKGQMFSTFDRDQDSYYDSCAVLQNGAWWYKTCAYSNLNGLHKTRESWRAGGAYYPYMCWYHFNNDCKPLKTSKMMIRAV